MKSFDHIFRAALLLILVAGLIVATWHISWLHKHGRYEMQLSDRRVIVLDQQERVVYAGQPYEEPIVWHTSPLPKEP